MFGPTRDRATPQSLGLCTDSPQRHLPPLPRAAPQLEYFADLPFRPGMDTFQWIFDSGVPVHDVRVPTTVIVQRYQNAVWVSTEDVAGVIQRPYSLKTTCSKLARGGWKARLREHCEAAWPFDTKGEKQACRDGGGGGVCVLMSRLVVRSGTAR